MRFYWLSTLCKMFGTFIKHPFVLKHIEKYFNFCRRFNDSFKKFKPVTLIFNPSNYLEEHPDHVIYQCPICLKNSMLFANQEVLVTSEFSFDHYPPKSVGGWKKSLACKECNNKSGSNFEDELEAELQRRSYIKKIPGSKLYVKAIIKNVPGGPYKSSMTMQSEGIGLLDIGSLAKTPHVVQWAEDLKIDPTKFEISVSGTLPDAAKIKKSIIKSAYWYCFSRWGYQFTNSIGGTIMRKYIVGECEYPLEYAFLYWVDGDTSMLFEGIGLIHEPKEMMTFIAHIPMSIEEIGYKCVVGIPIPNPTKNCFEDISKLFSSDLSKPFQYILADNQFVTGVRNYEKDLESAITEDIQLVPIERSTKNI